MFFACIDCIIQYFLFKRFINNPCFRNFGESFFPPLFVFIIFSWRKLKNTNSFCPPRSTTANCSTVNSWHSNLEDTLCWSHFALFYLSTVFVTWPLLNLIKTSDGQFLCFLTSLFSEWLWFTMKCMQQIMKENLLLMKDLLEL